MMTSVTTSASAITAPPTYNCLKSNIRSPFVSHLGQRMCRGPVVDGKYLNYS